MYHQQPSISLVTPNYHHQNHPPMPLNHGNVLEVTVVGCHKLKDTEWISRQDPYVCLEYGNTRNRTRVCTDGGKNPTFQEKFVYSVVEGLRELNVIVWNSNTISRDDFIGSGKVHLGKVLSQGYDDSSWPLHTKHGRHGGEVRLIMHYSGANANTYHVTPQVSMYSAPPQPPSSMVYPPATTGAYLTPSTYPPQLATYPPQPYPPNPVYPPQPYGSHNTHGSPYPAYSLY